MSTLYDAALGYVREGYSVVPVPHGAKNPGRDGWQHLRIDVADLDQYFNGHPMNIGLILGEPSGGLVDVDSDCEQALLLGTWLPCTGRISGRAGRPRSHHWYRAHGISTTQYRDIDGKMLIELRSTGGQTIVPPSMHESGEAIVWEEVGEPAEVDPKELHKAVAHVAAASILARHWPATGSRHEAAKALSGMLLRADWSEEDVATFVDGVAFAAGDDEWQTRKKNVATTARRLDNNGKATGAKTLIDLLHDGAQVLDRVRDWLGLPAVSTTSVEKLAAPEWPEPPGEAAFAGLAGRIVAAADPHTEADTIAILGQLLTAFGNAVGNGPHMWVGATRHTPRVFCVLVGRSAKARKGDAWAVARAVLQQAAPEWIAERGQSGLSTGEGLLAAVRDAIEKNEPIREKGQITGYQPVTIDDGVSDKRLLVVEPELARVLKVLGRQGNTLSPVLRDAWDTGDLQTMTRSNPVRATGAHISLIGHITAEELRRELADTEMVNGFANRIIWLAVKRSKSLPDPVPFAGRVVETLASELSQTLAWARGVTELRRDSDAAELWRMVYDDLSQERDGLAGALLARAEAHVLRLSMIYALLDRSTFIRPDHLLSALELWAYAERSVTYIYGDRIGDPVADAILEALVHNRSMSRTQISNLFGRNESASRISRALQTLLNAGKVRTYSQDTGGRPVEMWEAV